MHYFPAMPFLGVVVFAFVVFGRVLRSLFFFVLYGNWVELQVSLSKIEENLT